MSFRRSQNFMYELFFVQENVVFYSFMNFTPYGWKYDFVDEIFYFMFVNAHSIYKIPIPYMKLYVKFL